MSIHFSTKNLKFPGPLKAYTETQLLSIEKLVGHIIDADIVVNEEKIIFRVEISVKTSLSSFFGAGEDRILKQAVRNALNAVKTQAKKFKEKIKEEKKRAKLKTVRVEPAVPVKKRKEKTDKEEKKEGILISTNFSRKPISVEEAIFFLKESQENSFMFINSDSNKMATLFWNKQGDLSLIEPDI